MNIKKNEAILILDLLETYRNGYTKTALVAKILNTYPEIKHPITRYLTQTDIKNYCPICNAKLDFWRSVKNGKSTCEQGHIYSNIRKELI